MYVLYIYSYNGNARKYLSDEDIKKIIINTRKSSNRGCAFSADVSGTAYLDHFEENEEVNYRTLERNPVFHGTNGVGLYGWDAVIEYTDAELFGIVGE